MSAPDPTERGGWMRAITLAALVVTGCVYSGGEEIVTIVDISCEPQMGFPDCTTTVETDDRRRYRRVGDWGQVGDTMLVEIVHERPGGSYWRPVR